MILVLSSDTDLIAQIRTLMSEQDRNLHSATDGFQLLEMLQSHIPRLVILDARNSELNVFGLCRIIRFSPATRAIPVFIISNDRTPDQAVHARNCGSKSFFVRPLDVGIFKAELAEVLDL